MIALRDSAIDGWLTIISAGEVLGDCVLCFFFQAEDGIRDVAVTGVQTCALPIYGLAQGLQSTRGKLFQDDRRPLKADAGAGVVLDTHGGVVALTSYPTFDLPALAEDRKSVV